MNTGPTAIQYMGMIMKGTKINIQYALSLAENVNHSSLSAKDVITILQQIFKNEKSAKILIAVQVLEYLVKNCNINFHQAANRESFQKSILGLLKRQRGKTNIFKQFSSNTENWSRIEAKTLHLVQLWYDAFILEQSKYIHIINTYKVLRKENVMFPPRNINEKSLLSVQTQSPIFDNIQKIAQTDKEKFKKRLRAMGRSDLLERMNNKDQQAKTPTVSSLRNINIDDFGEKMAIVQSQDFEGANVMPIIEQLKVDMEFGRVQSNEQQYWSELKEIAQKVISDWEQKNAELIQRKQEEYLSKKLSKATENKNDGLSQNQITSQVKASGEPTVSEILNCQILPKKQDQKQTQEINLLDL